MNGPVADAVAQDREADKAKSPARQLAEALAYMNNVVVVSPDDMEWVYDMTGFISVHGYEKRIVIMDREIGTCGSKRYVLAQ